MPGLFTLPGILGEKMHAFAAYDLEKSQAALEEAMEIEILPTPFVEAIAMIPDGRIVGGNRMAMELDCVQFSRSTTGVLRGIGGGGRHSAPGRPMGSLGRA